MLWEIIVQARNVSFIDLTMFLQNKFLKDDFEVWCV